MQTLPDDLKYTYYTAISIMAVFVIFIIFIVILYNRKQILFIKEKQLKEAEHQNQLLQNELERQKSIEKERERISHDMHDDLGAGISAMKLQAEFLKKKVKDENLKSDVEDLLKISDEMNISMREILWSLNTNNDTVNNLIEYTSKYAENFLRNTEIKTHILFPDNPIDTKINAEKRRNLFLCIKEALNNVYKHSKAKNVHINFSQNKEQLLVSVKDDGIGFQKSNDGYGLQNMKIRMEKIGGSMSFSENENGSNIKFEVKLNQ